MEVGSDAMWRQVASPVGFDCIREGEVLGVPPPGAPDLAKIVVMAEVVPAPAGKLTASALPLRARHHAFQLLPGSDP